MQRPPRITEVDIKEGLTLEEMQHLTVDMNRERAYQAELAKFKALDDQARGLRAQLHTAVEATGRRVPAYLFTMGTGNIHDFIHQAQQDLQE